MTYFTLFLKFIVGLVVLLVWTTVGFLLYVPLLARQIAVYSVALSAASLGKGSIDRAQASLEKAIEFFPKGYSLAWRVITAPDGRTSTSTSRPDPGISFWSLACEIFWSAVFWASTAWTLGYNEWAEPLLQLWLRMVHS